MSLNLSSYQGLAYQEMLQYDSALRYLQQSLNINPQSHVAYYNMGTLYNGDKSMSLNLSSHQGNTYRNMKQYD